LNDIFLLKYFKYKLLFFVNYQKKQFFTFLQNYEIGKIKIKSSGFIIKKKFIFFKKKEADRGFRYETL